MVLPHLPHSDVRSIEVGTRKTRSDPPARYHTKLIVFALSSCLSDPAIRLPLYLRPPRHQRRCTSFLRQPAEVCRSEQSCPTIEIAVVIDFFMQSRWINRPSRLHPGGTQDGWWWPTSDAPAICHASWWWPIRPAEPFWRPSDGRHASQSTSEFWRWRTSRAALPRPRRPWRSSPHVARLCAGRQLRATPATQSAQHGRTYGRPSPVPGWADGTIPARRPRLSQQRAWWPLGPARRAAALWLRRADGTHRTGWTWTRWVQAWRWRYGWAHAASLSTWTESTAASRWSLPRMILPNDTHRWSPMPSVLPVGTAVAK